MAMEEALGWSEDRLPPGGALVMIKDCVAAKGAFFLTFFLKKLLLSGHTRVVFVAMAEPFSHYGRIAKKQVRFFSKFNSMLPAKGLGFKIRNATSWMKTGMQFDSVSGQRPIGVPGHDGDKQPAIHEPQKLISPLASPKAVSTSERKREENADR